MTTLATILLILQLSSSLLTAVQNNTSISKSQKETAISFADEAIKSALAALNELPTSTISVINQEPKETQETQETQANPVIIKIITDQSTMSENLGNLGNLGAEVQANYSLRVTESTLKATGGQVSFQILDKNGEVASMKNQAGSDRLIKFTSAGFAGFPHRHFNTRNKMGVCILQTDEEQSLNKDTWTIPFAGVDSHPTITLDEDNNATLQIVVCGETIELKVHMDA